MGARRRLAGYTELWGVHPITAVLILGLAQTVVSRGDSLIPGFGGNRPVVAEQEEAAAVTNR